jgi:hypothetical protein
LEDFEQAKRRIQQLFVEESLPPWHNGFEISSAGPAVMNVPTPEYAWIEYSIGLIAHIARNGRCRITFDAWRSCARSCSRRQWEGSEATCVDKLSETVKCSRPI